MRKIVLAVSLTIIVIACLSCVKSEESMNVLVITGTHAYNQPAFNAMIAGFEGMDCTINEMGNTPGSLFEQADDFPYDAIVLYNFNQELSPEHQENFKEILRGGVGLTVIHHALAVFPEWTAYEDIIGASYVLEEQTRGTKHYPRPTWTAQKNGLIDIWDAEKVAARGPILIAHRGGVAGPAIPECSRKAVKMAATYLYDMVELDVRESKDHHPIVFHDSNMMQACGIDKKISDLNMEALTAVKFLESDECISSLDSMLKLCRALDLGVMFDIKQGERSDIFFERILSLIDRYELDRACMTLGDSQVKERLQGKVLLPLSDEIIEKVKQGNVADLHGYYWFGVPEKWPLELIKPLQENGALVIPALNTFRYSEEHHRSEARKDAERLLKAGVDGFQIDCVYQDYFGRPKLIDMK